MHPGRLDRDTAAARVHKALQAAQGRWIDGWRLSQLARVTAVSTRVSEIRHQGVAVEAEMRVWDGQRQWYYRIPKG